MNSARRNFLQGLAGIGAMGLVPPTLAAPGASQASGPSRKLGVALVGLGRLSKGQLAPALAKNSKRCRLAGLVSGHPAKAKAWAQQYGVPARSVYDYDNFDRIRDNPDIDVVYVVLPNSMHAEFTIRAAQAGKHVLCEKPMATSVAECDAMIAACKKANRQLAIGYRLHFEPNNLEMVRLAREKVLGPVKIIEAAAGFPIGDPKQWRLNKALSGGGSLFDIGIYALQAARYISGEEPSHVSAQMSITDPVKFKPGVDESLSFSLKFPSGIIANCASSYAVGLNRFWAGTPEGWFEVAPGLNYHGIRGRSNTQRKDKPFSFPDIDQFAAEMDDFAECITTGRATRVPGEEGRMDQRLMAAIYKAASSGKTVALRS